MDFPPLFPILISELLFLIVKVLAPIDVKLLVIPALITSIEVRIPTKAVIPIAMIIIVRNVLKDCDLMELTAIFMFSMKTLFICF